MRAIFESTSLRRSWQLSLPEPRAAQLSDFERRSLAVFAFLAPFDLAGRFVSGSFVPISAVVGASVLPIGLRVLAGGRLARWSWPLFGFLAVALVSTAASGDPTSSRAIGQLVFMSASVVFALTAGIALRGRLVEVEALLRPLVLGSLVLATSSIVQSLIGNVLHHPGLADWTGPINSALGGPGWRTPGFVGPLERANGLAAEPAHLASDLTPGLILSLMRLRCSNDDACAWATRLMGRATAIAIVVGYVLTVSVLAMAILAIIVLSLLISARRGVFLRLVGTLLIGLSLAFGISSSARSAFLEKVQTLPLAVTAAEGHPPSVTTVKISALALAANASVTAAVVKQSPWLGRGVGSSASNYALYAPQWVDGNRVLDGLNAADAGALLLRLVQEVGLIGLLLWSVMTVTALFGRATTIPATLFARLALLASAVAALTRYPVYYWPLFWMLLAMTTGGRDAAAP